MRTVTIQNIGSELLEGLDLSIDGVDLGSFSIGNLGTTNLAAGASETFDVVFLSNETGSRQATLSIASNDADENPFVIALSGTHSGSYYWDHFAGSATEPASSGNATGTGSAARFLYPWGIASDSNGTVYLADTSNHRIRKISPNGVVADLVPGFGFNYPHAIACDTSGTLYVADTSNNRVVKISPSGVVTILATGLSLPRGIAVDASGTIYVANTGDHTIRSISPEGTVTLLAGPAGFSGPAGIAVGSDGVVYVSDTGNNRILKIVGSVITTIAGGISSPLGLAVDGRGYVFVASEGSDQILVVPPSGTPVPIGGLNKGNSAGFGYLDSSVSARFNRPAGVTIAPDGKLYVVGGYNHNVMVGRPQFPGPGKIMLENSTAKMAVIPGSTENFHQISKGTLVTRVFNISNAPGASIIGEHASDFSYTRTSTTLTLRFTPSALGVRNAQLEIGSTTTPYVLNLTGTGVAPLVWSAVAGSGTYPTVAGVDDGIGRAAGFRNPSGVAADGSGNRFIADTGNHAIRKIAPGGVVTTFAGLPGTSGNSDGVGGEARFNSPKAITFGPDGVLYVAESGGIRKITADGTVTSLPGGTFSWGIAISATGDIYGASSNVIVKLNAAGGTLLYAGIGTSGKSDGPALSASFSSPRGMTFDAAGNLYVADYGNRLIRKITPENVVSTFAGSGISGSTDGQGTLATFSGPSGIAIDGTGDLLVTDGGRIRRISPSAQVTTLGGGSITGNLEGIGSAARFNSPVGIAATLDGRIHLAGGNNHNIMSGTPLSSAPDIAVLPTGNMSLVNGANGANLGDIPGAPVSMNFAIRNYGLASLGNLGVALGTGSSSDFSINAATTATDLASGGETSFSVTFTPSSTGPRTASVEVTSTDPDENPFIIQLSGTGLTVREKWRFDQFGSWENIGAGADLGDPDNDGLENLLEFAFNLDPNFAGVPVLPEVGGTSGLPLIRNVAGNLKIEFMRRKPAFASGVTYLPQFGSSLDDPLPDGWIDFSVPEIVTGIDTVWERVIVEDPAEGMLKRFGRVKVMAP